MYLKRMIEKRLKVIGEQEKSVRDQIRFLEKEISVLKSDLTSYEMEKIELMEALGNVVQ